MSQNTPLFHSTWYIKGIRKWAVKNYAVFHIIMKRSDIIQEVRWAAYFQEDLEKPRFSPGQRWGQWIRCTVTVSVPYSFLVIFWWRISCQLLIVWHGSHTVTLDNLSLFKLLETLQENSIKEFSSDSEGCDTSIVVAISPALLVFVEGNYVCVSHVLL